MSEAMIELGETKLNCRIDGREGAPWLVFSNSLMTDLHLWDAQVAALADRYRILRYDQRGHGKSAVPTGPSHFDGLAADLLALLDANGIARATLIGISMGAATVLRAAMLAPQRVAGLVLCDGQAATPAGGAAAWDERVAIAEQGGMQALAGPTFGRWFLPDFVAQNNAALAGVRAMITATPFAGFLSCVRALQNYDYRAGLPALDLPALLIAGAQDGAMPGAMRLMAETMPQARFVEIAQSGHLPCIEQPQAYNAALEAFLAELA